jgi:hypothetical protein
MATVEQILNADLAKPAVSLAPSAAAGVSSPFTFSRESDAWTLDPFSRKYEKVSSGEPRIWGPQQGILLDPSAKTQLLSDSVILDPGVSGNWGKELGGFTTASRESIIGDLPTNGEATKFTPDSANASIKQFPGTISGDTEALMVIAEDTDHGTVNKHTDLSLNNNTANNNYGFLEYSWSTDTIKNLTGEGFVEKFSRRGPNGGDLAFLFLRGSGVAGDSRKVRISPESENNSSIILHHAQLLNNRYPAPPIVTPDPDDGDQNPTVFDESLNLQTSEVNLSKTGTWVLELKVRSKFANNNEEILGSQGSNFAIELGDGKAGSPYSIDAVAGNNSRSSPSFGRINAYETARVVFSFDYETLRLGVNGEVSETNEKVTSWSYPDPINVNLSSNNPPILFTKITHSPEILDANIVKALSTV